MHCCRRPGQCDRLPPRQQNSAEPGAEDEFITPFRASSRHAGRHEAASAVAGGRNFSCAPFHHDRSAEWISPAPDRNFKTLILQTAAAAGMIQRYRILSGGEAFRLIAVPNERGELQFAISNRQRRNFLSWPIGVFPVALRCGLLRNFVNAVSNVQNYAILRNKTHT